MPSPLFTPDDRNHEALDELITFVQAASELPRRRAGKPTVVGTIYAWSTHGAGKLQRKLRWTQVGSTRCTTRRWLRDFFEQLAADKASEAEHKLSGEE